MTRLHRPAPIARATWTLRGASRVPYASREPVEVTWTHGTLAGDPGMVAAARDRAAALDGQIVGPWKGR